MNYTAPQAIRPQTSYPFIQTKRVLIISDSATRLAELRSLLGKGGVEIKGVMGSAEAVGREQSPYDYVILDLSAPRLAAALRSLREHPSLKNASILVEAGRVLGGDLPAGLLPAYRAMACGRAELQRLICRPKPGAGRFSARHALL
jgi:CheY-like chemotaxis protein